MDSRDIAAIKVKWYQSFNERTMKVFADIWLPETNDMFEFSIEMEIPVKYEICNLCNGKGGHGNSSVDLHDLDTDDFDEDEIEGYVEGRFDMICNECLGKRVILVPDKERFVDENYEIVCSYIKDLENHAFQECHEREMGY